MKNDEPDHFMTCMELIRRTTEAACMEFGASQNDMISAMATTMIAVCKTLGMPKDVFMRKWHERWDIVQIEKVVRVDQEPIH